MFVSFWNVSASLKAQLSPLSGLNRRISVTRSHRSGKESGRRSWSPLWRSFPFVVVVATLTLLYFYISYWWRETGAMCLYLTVVRQSEARVRTKNGIQFYLHPLISAAVSQNTIGIMLWMSNYIPQNVLEVIAYQCTDIRWSLSVKETTAMQTNVSFWRIASVVGIIFVFLEISSAFAEWYGENVLV